MKKFLVEYVLYIYVNFISNNEIDTYKKWAQPFIKFLNFLNNIYIWIASIVFFPIFVICMRIDKKMKSFKTRRKLIIYKNIYF